MTAFEPETPSTDRPPESPDSLATPDPDREEQGPPEAPPPGPYAAKAGSYFRNVRYVIFVAILAMGAWFCYDGFVKYPEERAEYRRLAEEIRNADAIGDSRLVGELRTEQERYQDHSDTDLLLQRVLGIALPPIGVLLLIRWLHISRGEIRLDENDVLHVPSHPPVPVSGITEIDDSQWERKGISRISYDAAGDTGQLKLDDFIYERGPIDRIHDRLVYLKGSHNGAPGFSVEE